jgi:hypothetical protein
MTIKNFPDDVNKLLAIRYLDASMTPIACSSGWKLDLVRPILKWSAEQKTRLASGQIVQHSLFCPHPSDPTKFGPVQFLTQKLTHDTEEFCEACYFQQGHPLPETGSLLEEIGRSVDGIIRMMRDAGFIRGRYYHLADVPGLRNPSLELIALKPKEPNKLPLPVTKEMDDLGGEFFSRYHQKFQSLTKNERESTLFFELRNIVKQKEDEDVVFWNQYIDNTGVSWLLDVPVFLTAEEIEKKKDRDLPKGKEFLRTMQGAFVFDKGNADKLDEKEVRAIEPSLTAALNYFSQAMLKERDHFERNQATLLLKFHQQVSKQSNGLRIEEQLIDMAADLSHLDSLNHAHDRSKRVRSASYARYNHFLKCLEVTCETKGSEAKDNDEDHDVMKGLELSLEKTRFIHVRCANRALDANDPDRELPMFVPNYPKANQAEKIEQKHWLEIPKMSAQRLKKCELWLKNEVISVAAFPVISKGQLLGVLALRSNRSHDFTRKRVEGIKQLIEIALPYLERVQYEINRRTWDGLVMHEMRSNLSWALTKVDRAENAKDEVMRKRAISDLSFVLEDGVSLSSMLLNYLHFTEINDEISTDNAFWNRLNEYGIFRKNSSSDAQWQWVKKTSHHGADSLRLGRAVRVLIDNAFRYANIPNFPISCEIELDSNCEHLIIKVTNPGILGSHSPTMALTSKFESFGNLSGPVKADIGITLVKMLCRDVRGGGDFNLDCEERESEPSIVTATLKWPISE